MEENAPLIDPKQSEEKQLKKPVSILKADWKRLLSLAVPEWPLLFMGTSK